MSRINKSDRGWSSRIVSSRLNQMLISLGFGDAKYDGDPSSEELKEEQSDAAKDTSHAHTPEFALDTKGSPTEEGESPLADHGDPMDPSELIPSCMESTAEIMKQSVKLHISSKGFCVSECFY